ncbi:ATP-dependent DNA/RNA helicase [Pseudocyphellaria aurata]|nr:ATP-dependent DNA/RNA helicase [Pseudocyphellaria aurata]
MDHKRKHHQDNITPASIPEDVRQPPSAFSALGLDARLLQAVVQQRFSTPTLVQTKAIPQALEGKDIVARAKTGSGKTLAYVLPVLESILRRKTNHQNCKGPSVLILVPTRELAQQVSKVVVAFSAHCNKEVRILNLTQKISENVQRSLLAELPDIIVATPSRICLNLNTSVLSLDNLTHIVIDEADLVLSYGYEEDLHVLAKVIPKRAQKILMSATMTVEVETLKTLFCQNPIVLELDEPGNKSGEINQFTVKCAEDEKFLLVYVIFKLKLLKGKCIIFVSEIDRCYRLKLFLEQFGIRSCVLNSELPVNSRIHVVEEFNKNAYDIIIASDEHEVFGERTGGGLAKYRGDSISALPDNKASPVLDADHVNHQPSLEREQFSRTEQIDEDISVVEPPKKKRKAPRKNKEYGISRGIDFKNVACVLNFDLPLSSRSYTHRIGRTARAGRSGMALSFVVPKELYRKHKATTSPSAEHDEAVLNKIADDQSKNGKDVRPYHFDMKQVEAFRYRMVDALSAVTRIAIREARTRELRQELLKSDKLKRHFEENPEDLQHLRHDGEIRAVRVQAHLKHVPDYLMPSTGTKSIAGVDVGFVPVRKMSDNRIRKARVHNRLKGRGRESVGRKMDPLKAFKTKGAR